MLVEGDHKYRKVEPTVVKKKIAQVGKGILDNGLAWVSKPTRKKRDQNTGCRGHKKTKKKKKKNILAEGKRSGGKEKRWKTRTKRVQQATRTNLATVNNGPWRMGAKREKQVKKRTQSAQGQKKCGPTKQPQQKHTTNKTNKNKKKKRTQQNRKNQKKPQKKKKTKKNREEEDRVCPRRETHRTD